jgi:hypothetical protein
VGYLLKDRVADVTEFTEAVSRVAAGGTALDREVVSQLLAASRHAGNLDPLTPRERDVLALMAEGRSNAGIAAALATGRTQALKPFDRTVRGTTRRPASRAASGAPGRPRRSAACASVLFLSAPMPTP